MNASEKQAQLYKTFSVAQQNEGHNLLDILGSIDGYRVLDLGCGTGYFSGILSKLVGPHGFVLAIDPDTDRLQIARKTYVLPNLRFEIGSAETTYDEQFDLVFCNYVLHWCKDKNVALRNISASLRTGGKLAFSVILKDIIEPKSLYSDRLYRLFKNSLPTFKAVEYSDIAKEHGLIPQYFEEFTYKQRFEDAESLVIFYKMHTRGKCSDKDFNKKEMQLFCLNGYTKTAPALRAVLTKI